MSAEIWGLITFSVLCVACPSAAHLLLRRTWFATIVGAFLAVFLFQVAGYLYLGYLDAWWEIAVVTTSAIALVVSTIIGLIFRAHRQDVSNDSARTQL